MDFPPVPAAAVPQPSAQSTGTQVRVVSAGFESGSAADFILDGIKVKTSGQAGGRGVNAIAIDPGSGQVLSAKSYDIWGNPGVENTQLAADLNALSDDIIVLVALKDSGMENLDARAVNALRGVGSTISGPLGVREGYALIGTKGRPALAESRGSRVEVEATLPCFVSPPSAGSVAARPRQPAFSSQPPAPPTRPAPPQWAPQPARSEQPRPAAPPPAPKVTFNDAMAEREAAKSGQSWQEVVLMLDRLQEKIKAKRLSGVSGDLR